MLYSVGNINTLYLLMSVLIFSLVAVAAVTAYFSLGKIQAHPKPSPNVKKANIPNKALKTKPSHLDFRCVAIKTGLIHCKAVTPYKSKRMLMSEAPMLPISGCNSKDCECKFIRYEDRRRGDRRTVMKAAASQIISEHDNKRVRVDRRKSKTSK